MIGYVQFLIVISLVNCHSLHATNAVYHIKKSTNVSCPEEPCLTLPQLAANIETYLESNTTIIFLPGNHHLDSYINISAVSNLSIYSSSISSCCPTVLCEQNAGTIFLEIDYVYIGYMKFIGCNSHQAIAVNMFILDNAIFLYHSESAFQFISSNAEIVRCSFILNTGGSLRYILLGLRFTTEDLLLMAIFGDIYRYAEAGAAIAITQSNTVIKDCMFEGNQAKIGGALFVEQLGNVTIINTTFEQNYATCHLSTCTSGAIYSGNSTIAVFNSTFYGNKLVDKSNYYCELYGGVFGLFESTFIADHCIIARNGIENVTISSSRYSVGNAIFANNTILKISSSSIINNCNTSRGGAMSLCNTICIITKTIFENNSAEDNGGVIFSENSTIMVYESKFKFNLINSDLGNGGVFTLNYTNITIIKSAFEDNIANSGGVMTTYDNNKIDIMECNFTRNYATNGGVFCLHWWHINNKISITDSLCKENFAEQNGGVIDIQHSEGNVGNIIFKNMRFIKNKSKYGGAVICSASAIKILVSECEFISNTAFTGGALCVTSANVIINGGIMERNHVYVGLIYAVQEASISMSGTYIRNTYTAGNPTLYFLNSKGNFSKLTLANNQGLIFALYSTMTFNDIVINCSPKLTSFHYRTYQDGGAITLIQSETVLRGTCFLNRSYALKGGAISATDSKIHIYGNTTIAYNTAWMYGGGIYLHNSELTCYSQCLLELFKNRGGSNGGGIHAIGSSISVENTGIISIQGNSAKDAGGGIFLELNSKLYIIVITDIESPPYTLTFINNSANYGGALYVADDINSCTCASRSYKYQSTTTECFIQLLDIQDDYRERFYYHIVVTVFSNNHAYISGSNIFGGLLDRCTFSKFSVTSYFQRGIVVDGATYFTYISEINQFDSFSSKPVRICFCNKDKQPNCSYHPQPIEVRKGNMFTVPLVAVDQVNNTVPNVTIRSHVLRGGLGENQLLQSTGEGCTDLTFQVFSSHKSEKLVLYADGPCKDAPLSQSTLEINFSICDCPIGFQPNTAIETRCECECNSNLQPYASHCDPKAEIIIREGDFWVNYIKNYLIYPHCPFDYCKPSNERVKINLNIDSGADAQCANNRSGTLCGQCSFGTSLSIGTSHCIQCPRYWPLLTAIIVITNALAGILFVALVLFLNLTVAVGTLNGVIFYANIVAANTNSVFPPNVIIAWLNLEPGINTCFFNSMTTYWKTWLQLAFPTYLIFLVALIISISERSKKFSMLIGKKDPVATLATLILFSYAKLLHTIIASLLGTTLMYPEVNDTHDNVIVWLPDATVKYLSGQHIPLFIVAILILLAGIMYTTLLFSWQWLVGLKLFNYTPKFSLFIQTYHIPYAPKHRYWTGLLLIVQIILYIIFATNVKGDPKVNLIAIGTAVMSILIIKDFVEGDGHLYLTRAIEMIEICCHFNLVLLCIISFFTLENIKIKNIVAQISMSITIVLFLAVLLYHLFSEGVFKTKVWKKYKKRQRQLMSITMDTTAARDNILSKPSYSVIERPKQVSKPVRGRKKGRKPHTDGAYEIREILIDQRDASYDT